MTGVAQYVPMHSKRNRSAQDLAGKRKACEAVSGIVTEYDLDSWMSEVGIDESMLDELLNDSVV